MKSRALFILKFFNQILDAVIEICGRGSRVALVDDDKGKEKSKGTERN